MASSDGPVLKVGGDRNITDKSDSVPSTQVSMLMKEKLVLQQQLEERKEKLRKLRMVKMYREKVKCLITFAKYVNTFSLFIYTHKII